MSLSRIIIETSVSLRGKRAFTVARDPDRPFTVRSDSLYAHALGTIFSVRLQENRNSVTVLEHAVQVSETSESTTTSPLIIKEGQQVSFSNSHGLGEVHAVDMIGKSHGGEANSFSRPDRWKKSSTSSIVIVADASLF